MMPRVPVVLLTGFLGSGKTTLLNQLLAHEDATNTAFIINEFGAVGIDGDLVEQADEGIVEMSNGCLCCTIRGDLADTIEGLFLRSAPPKRVVIETTGLADPLPILQTLMGHIALSPRLDLRAVLTVIDGVNGLSTLERYKEAQRQVAVADWIYISKADRDEAVVSAVEQAVRRINPTVRQWRWQGEAGGAKTGLTALMDFDFAAVPGSQDDLHRSRAGERAAALDDQNAEGHHDHHHNHQHHRHSSDDQSHDHGSDAHDANAAHGHDGHHHHHDPNRHGAIQAMVLEHDHPIARTALDGFVDLLRATQGAHLLRLKGFVRFSDDPSSLYVIQAAQQIVDAAKPAPARVAQTSSITGCQLVLVLDDGDQTYVRKLFDGFTNRPAIDTADRKALQDNPLSIPGVS
ncbi:MAG: GTP-binding protein [Pseudomonadota bacterium]